MYNSFIIRLLMKIWDILVLGYQGSLVKNMVDNIITFISFLFKGSIVKNIFVEDSQITLKSDFYRINSWIVEKGNWILKSLNNYIKRIGNSSVAYKSTYKLFKNEMEIIRTISIFFLFFGIGIIINGLRIGNPAIRPYLTSFMLILGSLIVIFIGEKLNDYLNNSYLYNFIKDLFSIDEGSEQWW